MFGPRPRTVFGLVDVPGRPTPRLILVKPSNEGLLLGPHLSPPNPSPISGIEFFAPDLCSGLSFSPLVLDRVPRPDICTSLALLPFPS